MILILCKERLFRFISNLFLRWFQSEFFVIVFFTLWFAKRDNSWNSSTQTYGHTTKQLFKEGNENCRCHTLFFAIEVQDMDNVILHLVFKTWNVLELFSTFSTLSTEMYNFKKPHFFFSVQRTCNLLLYKRYIRFIQTIFFKLLH